MRRTIAETLRDLWALGFETEFHDETFLNRIASYAPRSEPILIIGETGTGKDLIAQAIHNLSERKGRFLPILCPGIPTSLIESHLFGHKKGSFTGAIKDRKGAFEQAENGTVFLDEIGDIPSEIQLKLLRVLNDGTYTPLGDDSGKEKKTNARIISATNKEILHESGYRRDLYERLGVLILRIPSLREIIQNAKIHGSDIYQYFNDFVHSNISQLCNITNDAIDKLISYNWPGNFRELKSVLLRAYIENEGKLPPGKHLFLKLLGFGDDGDDGLPTIIEASMIHFDTEVPLSHIVDVTDMTILETLEYADRMRARIVDEKMQSIKNLRGTLITEGVPPKGYQNIRKKINLIRKNLS